MILLTPWLNHLEEYLPIARTGHDPEGVHQMRVALRRLRVWLELAGNRVLEDDLAWLVRGAGQVRDLEVLLQDPSLPKPFQDWARNRLEEARAEFLPMLDSPRLPGLLVALSVMPPLVKKEAERELLRFGEGVRRRGVQWQQQGGFEALHALRRALRKLRYGLEWLERDSDAIKELQEVLGRVGDLNFSLRYVRMFEAEGGQVVRYKKSLEARLQVAHDQARQTWKAKGGQPGD